MARKIAEEAARRGLRVTLVAPSHDACRMLGGESITLHRYCHAFSGRAIRKVCEDLLIIDEACMAGTILYSLLSEQQFLASQTRKVLCVGDPEQYRAPFDWYHGNENPSEKMMESPIIKRLCGNNLIRLSQCRRSCVELFNLYIGVQLSDLPGLRTRFPFKMLSLIHI